MAGHRKTRTQLDPTKRLKAAPGDSVASVFGWNGSLQDSHQWSVYPHLLFPSSGTSWAEPGKREPSQGPGTLSERPVGLPLLTLPHWCLPKTLGCEVHRLLSRSWGKPGRNASSSLGKCRRWSSQASSSPRISPTLGYSSWRSVHRRALWPSWCSKPFLAVEARQIPFCIQQNHLHLLPQTAFCLRKGALYPQRRTAAPVSKQMGKGEAHPSIALWPQPLSALQGPGSPKGPSASKGSYGSQNLTRGP